MEVVLDVILPGKVTEIHPMGKFGRPAANTMVVSC